MEASALILINESGMRMIFDQFIDRPVDLLLDVTAQALGGFTARRGRDAHGLCPRLPRQEGQRPRFEEERPHQTKA